MASMVSAGLIAMATLLLSAGSQAQTMRLFLDFVTPASRYRVRQRLKSRPRR